MADQQAPHIDPEGIQAGHPDALDELVDTFGPSVLGFCLELCGTDRAAIAAAEAFARFRAALVTLGEGAGVQPEVLLLAAVRHAGSGAANLDLLWASARIQDRDPPCEMIPTMLAARATGQLTEADLERVAKHLWRCEGCRLVEAAFNRAEQAYGEPTTAPEPHEAELMMSALVAAAPITAEPEVTQAPDLAVANAPEPGEPDAEPPAAQPETEPEAQPETEPGDDIDADILGDVDPPGFLDDADFDPRARPTVLFDALAPDAEAPHAVEDDADDAEEEWYEPAQFEGAVSGGDAAQEPRRRSATLTFSLLALVAVIAALGAAVAIEGLPGQDDTPKKTTPVTNQAPPADPVPTTPATS